VPPPPDNSGSIITLDLPPLPGVTPDPNGEGRGNSPAQTPVGTPIAATTPNTGTQSASRPFEPTQYLPGWIWFFLHRQ
jgi:hypothetical protein